MKCWEFTKQMRKVRLVRACGSKLEPKNLLNITSHGQARKSLWIETVHSECPYDNQQGQARKSLWIETIIYTVSLQVVQGQARKSLWIETFVVPLTRESLIPVRLVRACGSKQQSCSESYNQNTGQARKSLWIET